MRLETVAMGMALALLALAGCTDDEGGTPAPADSRPSTIAELTEDPDAAKAVAEGIEALREGNSGTFTTHLEYADLTFDYYGSYRLDPAQQRVSVTAELAEGPAATEAVGEGGSFYVRLPPEGPVSSKCWVTGDPAQVTEVTGIETNADFNQVPGAIALAATAAGIAPTDARADEVLGSVDLATAASLISPRLPGLLGLVAGSDRVLARFTLDDGVLSAISVDGPAILASLAESGTEVDAAELEKVFGAATPIAVTLSDSGAEVVIEPPSPSAVIDLARPDAEERIAACDAESATGEPSTDQPSPSPRIEMRRAVRQLVEDNTGTFTSQVSVDNQLLTSVEGTYQLFPAAYTTHAAAYDDDGDVTLASSIAVGDQAWLKINPRSFNDETTCWVHLNRRYFSFAGLAAAGAGDFYPFAVGVAVVGRGERVAGIGNIAGTSDLYTMLSLVGIGVPEAFGLNPRSRGRADVTFDVDSGRITRWSADVGEIADSARRAGFEMDPENKKIAALVGQGGTIDVQLNDPTLEMDIRRPPASKVVEFVTDLEELDERLRICAAGSAGA